MAFLRPISRECAWLVFYVYIYDHELKKFPGNAENYLSFFCVCFEYKLKIPAAFMLPESVI